MVTRSHDGPWQQDATRALTTNALVEEDRVRPGSEAKPADNNTQSVVQKEMPVENEEPARGSEGTGQAVATATYSYESNDTRSTNWGNRPQETWWNYAYGGGDWRGWRNRGYRHFGPYGLERILPLLG
jgi:hypothetical protein